MSAPTRPDREPLRVLVVEDCKDTRDSLGILLERWGHEVELAADGASALAKAALSPPDVVLLDIGLPGMSGWDVAQHLRAGSHGQSAVLVALTGYGQEHDRQHARDVGCDLHLLKPVEPRILEEFLEEAETRKAELAPLRLNLTSQGGILPGTCSDGYGAAFAARRGDPGQ
jgi:CheY-like chemotaxis protein